ncbi:MAG: hypothetical protein GY798_28635 [Hyphomicrobiales bacterium]|nr:hypothetical protein [Hyphomicrobiales bacterium]
MAAVFPRADYRTVEPTVLAGTSKTTCFTVGDEGDDWADVASIHIVGAGTAKVHVKVSSNGTEREFNDDVTVVAGYPHHIECYPLHLEAGGTIAVEGEADQVVWITLLRGQGDSEG